MSLLSHRSVRPGTRPGSLPSLARDPKPARAAEGILLGALLGAVVWVLIIVIIVVAIERML